MKALIIYWSTYRNNTEKIAEIFAQRMKADVINIKNTKEIAADGYDIIGFGSGVYKESMAPKIFNCVENLELAGKDVFVFSTSGVGGKHYNKKLMKQLETKGANIKGSYACKGSFSSKEFSNIKIFEIMSKFAQGHPDAKDLRKAELFINKIMEVTE